MPEVEPADVAVPVAYIRKWPYRRVDSASGTIAEVSVTPSTASGSFRTLGPNHTLDRSGVNAPGNSTGSDKNASIIALAVGGAFALSANPRDARIEGWSTLCATRIPSVGLGSRTAADVSEGKNNECSCGLL